MSLEIEAMEQRLTPSANPILQLNETCPYIGENEDAEDIEDYRRSDEHPDDEGKNKQIS